MTRVIAIITSTNEESIWSSMCDVKNDETLIVICWKIKRRKNMGVYDHLSIPSIKMYAQQNEGNQPIGYRDTTTGHFADQ